MKKQKIAGNIFSCQTSPDLSEIAGVCFMAPGRYRGINNRLKWEFKNRLNQAEWNEIIYWFS